MANTVKITRAVNGWILRDNDVLEVYTDRQRGDLLEMLCSGIEEIDTGHTAEVEITIKQCGRETE